MDLKNKKRLFFHFLIIAALIGVGISYSKVYLFHIFLPFYLLFSFKPVDVKTVFAGSYLNKFILFTLVWFLVLILGAENRKYAINHLIFLSIGSFIMFAILSNIRSKQELHALLKTLLIVMSVEMVIAFFEMLGVFRWPVSSLSFYNQYFGRPNVIQELIVDTTTLDYLRTVPTGFHYNANDFAVLLVIAYPFLLLSKNKFVSYLFSVFILLLVVATSARIAFISVSVMLLLLFVMKFKNYFRVLLLNAFVLLLLVTNGLTFSVGPFKKINEIQDFTRTMVGLEPLQKAVVKEHSVNARMELIKNGIKLIKDNKGLGIGGGNAQYEMEKIGGVGKEKITSMHNFWLELAVEGGLAYALLFFLWYVIIGISLVKIVRTNNEDDPIPTACLIALVGFSFAAIAPSSCIYYFPMYILFGLSLAIVFVYKKESIHN